MDKASFLEIKNQLSFEKPLAMTLLIITADIALFLLGMQLVLMGGTLPYLLSQLVFAIFFFHNFSILHEAGHNNVSNKPLINNIVGHYSSLFCFLPFFPWKFIHTEHHTYTGNIDKDPTMKALKRIRDKGEVPAILRFGWRSWVPLAGLVQHFVFWLYPIAMWKAGKMDRTAFWKSLFSDLFIITVYAIVFSLLPQYFNWHNFWLSLVVYMVMVELVNLPHHSDMPNFDNNSEIKKLNSWEQHRTTRSCHYPFYISELLCLNFNYHIEHHYFPSLPWWRLRKARKLVKKAVGDEYSECVGIGWNIKNRGKSANQIFLNHTKL